VAVEVATPLASAASVADLLQVKASATVAEMELMATVLDTEAHKHMGMRLVSAVMRQHHHQVVAAVVIGVAGLRVDLHS
jgi:hypothetical protein